MIKILKASYMASSEKQVQKKVRCCCLFRAHLGALAGAHSTSSQAEAMMRQADVDGDGQIGYGACLLHAACVVGDHPSCPSSAEEFVAVCKRFPNLLFPVFAASQNISKLFK